MRTGKLNRRITFQTNAAPTRDAMGGVVEGWSDYVTVWAEPMPVHGAEFFAAAAVNQEQTVVFRIRYRGDLTVQMRVLDELTSPAQAYEITSIIDPDSRRFELEVRCARVNEETA